MKPILFAETATTFNNNGIGVLADAISCSVTEELNGMFELTLTYPITGIFFDQIAMRSIICAKPNPYARIQPFRVYKISAPMNGIVTINAQHLSYDLSGIPVIPFVAQDIQYAFRAFKDNAAVKCPFSFQTSKSNVSKFEVTVPSSIRSLLGGSSNSILNIYGGEYEFDQYDVKLHAKRGQNNGVSIKYGKNLLDLKQEQNCASVYTGVYPYWKDKTSFVQLDNKIVNADGTYNFVRILPLDLTREFKAKPSKIQLEAAAREYMTKNNIGTPSVSLTVSWVQLDQYEEYKHLALFERVALGDVVAVEFPKLGVSATAQVVKTIYDVLLDRYSSANLGDAKNNIADTISNQTKTVEEAIANIDISQFEDQIQNVVDAATQVITGNIGGYVVLHSSTGDSAPDEILIMDTNDIQTATNVWRWNKSGLGFSSTGYNGEYGLAMTHDGQIVADFITAGELKAANVKIVGGNNIFMSGANIYIYDPTEAGTRHNNQIRIGQYDGVHTGIAFTKDAGRTWHQVIDYNGISFSKISGTVTGTQISDNAITTGKIAANAITTNEIATGAVTANEIAASAITADKIAAGAITADKISAGTITSEKIENGAITSTKISGGAITTEKIAANAITANKIATGTITANEIASGTITGAKIAAGAITAEKLDVNTLTASKVASSDSTFSADIGSATGVGESGVGLNLKINNTARGNIGAFTSGSGTNGGVYLKSYGRTVIDGTSGVEINSNNGNMNANAKNITLDSDVKLRLTGATIEIDATNIFFAFDIGTGRKHSVSLLSIYNKVFPD